MDQRVSMIMNGAKDITRLRAFYEGRLGWRPWRAGGSGSIMYKVGHAILVFLDSAYLAKERGVPLAAGSNSSLALFVQSKDQVDQVLSQAVGGGALVTSGARDRDGGLYSAYFADPEGNSWEVVWSPTMPMDEDGALTLPG